MRSWLPWVLAVFLAPACDSSTTVEGSGGGSAAPSCDDFADETATASLGVTVENPTGQDVWLARDICAPSAFGITTMGEKQKLPVGNCSCEAQLSDTFACVFTCDGPSHELIRIPAGGSHTWSWQGLVYEDREMPQACYADQNNTFISCPQIVAAPDGAHSVSVVAYTGVTCSPGGGGDCTCDPASAGGSCSIEVFGFDSTDKQTLSADFTLPTDSSVTLTAM